MFPFLRKNTLTTTESVDIIEKIVYEYLKPLGFRKYGRTLHRFVDGDISQVVNFQNGCPAKGVMGILWVNIGIRVPESYERKFTLSEPQKKYYHEYECNMRTRLGSVVDHRDTYYNLKKDPEKIGKDILEKLKDYVLPVFDVLSSRDAILKFRKDYEVFDEFNKHMIPLEEAMIYGRRGNIAKATELFNRYYQKIVEEYNYDKEHGERIYLKKGETVMCGGQTIHAEKNGYYILYSANDAHIKVIEKLAEELQISLR